MKIEVSEGSSGVWSWRFKSDNGETVIAEGTKTFESKAEAKKAVDAFAGTVGVKANAVSYVPLFPEQEEEEK
jgi:uncharacterized protein YegP (UPF0339 family)